MWRKKSKLKNQKYKIIKEERQEKIIMQKVKQNQKKIEDK